MKTKLRLKKEVNAGKLRDQILTTDKSLLLCLVCGCETSSNKGDYWNVPEDRIFTHCGENMQLVTKKTVYERL